MSKFSADVRKIIYTTNAIESLNSSLRRLNSQRSISQRYSAFKGIVSLENTLLWLFKRCSALLRLSIAFVV